MWHTFIVVEKPNPLQHPARILATTAFRVLGSRLLLGATSRSFAGFARKGTRKPPRAGTNRRMEPAPARRDRGRERSHFGAAAQARARGLAGANGDAHAAAAARDATSAAARAPR